MKLTKYALALAVALGVIGIATPSGVRADTVEIRIINTALVGGGDTGWIQCASSSCAFIGPLGNYSLTADIAIQMLNGNPLLDLDYDASTASSSAGSIVFEAMADGYGGSNGGVYLIGNGNSTLGDTLSFAGYGGNSDDICAAGVNNCSPFTLGSTFLAGVGPLSDSSYGASAFGGTTNAVDPYSLSIVALLDSPTNKGTASGDIQLQSVPEPGTLSLLAIGLLGMVGVGLWRKPVAVRASAARI